MNEELLTEKMVEHGDSTPRIETFSDRKFDDMEETNKQRTDK